MQSLRSGFEARYWLRAIAVNRALELDPDLAEAHAALGATRFYFESDWSGADAEFRRALAINPGSQAALEEYGNFLGAMGHFDAGFAQTREAARLDPLSVGPVHNLAIIALARGDLEEAEAGFRQAIDIDPHWTWGYIRLARALTLQKRPEEALAQAEIGERRIAGGVAPLFAAIHGALGELGEALSWYERALMDRPPNMVYAAILSGFSPELLGNSRFQAIVDRMRRPKQSR
jgi:Flp pilus assembly protein TadD